MSTTVLHHGKPYFEVRAWLTCPHCRSVVEVVTPAQQLTIANAKKFVAIPYEKLPNGDYTHTFMECDTVYTDMIPVREYIYRATTVLAQQRKCEQCGIVSGLPEAHSARAKKDMSAKLDDEWFRTRIFATKMINQAAEPPELTTCPT